jgi:hypothetical protein
MFRASRTSLGPQATVAPRYGRLTCNNTNDDENNENNYNNDSNNNNNKHAYACHTNPEALDLKN